MSAQMLGYGEDNDGWYISRGDSQIAHGLTEQDARRFVGCVTALDGLNDYALLGVWSFLGVSRYAIGLERQRDELLLTETNLRQQIAHLTDALAGEKSTFELVIRQHDELLAALERLLGSYRLQKPDGYPKSDSEKQAEAAIASVKAVQT